MELSELDGVRKFLTKDVKNNSFSRQGMGIEHLLTKNCTIYLTDGSRLYLNETFKSYRVRIFVWIAKGVDEFNEEIIKLSAGMFDHLVKPEIVIVCMEFGAKYNAKKLHEKGVKYVIWISMNPFLGYLHNIITNIFLPACSSILKGDAFAEVLFDLEERAKELRPSVPCGVVPEDWGPSCQHALLGDMSTGNGRLKIVMRPEVDHSNLLWFRSRSLRRLRVDASDIQCLEALTTMLTSSDDHIIVFVAPSELIRGAKPTRRTCERARGLALLACNELVSRRYSHFPNGVFRIASRADLNKAELALTGTSRKALLWLDFEDTKEAAELPVSNQRQLEQWVRRITTGDLALSIVATSCFGHIDVMVNTLGSSCEYIHLSAPHGINVSTDAIVGTISIKPMDLNLLKDDAAQLVGSTKCVLDMVESKADFLSHVKSLIIPRSHRVSFYRDDDDSVKLCTVVKDVKSLTSLRDACLTGSLEMNFQSSLGLPVQFDLTSIAKLYESMSFRLETLTEHQQERLAECEKAHRLHIKAPAGTGKTFLAVNAILDFLESQDGNVLYVCHNKSLGYYFCKWLCHRFRRDDERQEAFARIFLLTGMSPIGVRRVDICVEEGRLVTMECPVAKSLNFRFTVVDEAHNVFLLSDSHSVELREAVVRILQEDRRSYCCCRIRPKPEECQRKLLLLSDSSQASESRRDSYPTNLSHIELNEVCRSSRRIILGATCFRLEHDTVTRCVHESDGLPIRTSIFKGPENNDRLFQVYARRIYEEIEWLRMNFVGLDLHDRLAIVVPNEEFRMSLCGYGEEHHGILGNLLKDNQGRLGQLLVPIRAVDASRVVNIRENLSNSGSIVVDSVEEMDGLERLAVFAVGLDSPTTTLAQRSICASIYRAVTRAQLFCSIVNEHIVDGWFEWLLGVQFDHSRNKLYFDEEYNRLSNTAAASKLVNSTESRNQQTELVAPKQERSEQSWAEGDRQEYQDFTAEHKGTNDRQLVLEKTARPLKNSHPDRKVVTSMAGKTRNMNLVFDTTGNEDSHAGTGAKFNPMQTRIRPTLMSIEAFEAVMNTSVPSGQTGLAEFLNRMLKIEENLLRWLAELATAEARDNYQPTDLEIDWIRRIARLYHLLVPTFRRYYSARFQSEELKPPPEVFVSHIGHDRQSYVAPLANHLESINAKVFIDIKIPIGSKIEDEMPWAATSCRNFWCVLDKEFTTRWYSMRELMIGYVRHMQEPSQEFTLLLDCLELDRHPRGAWMEQIFELESLKLYQPNGRVHDFPAMMERAIPGEDFDERIKRIASKLF